MGNLLQNTWGTDAFKRGTMAPQQQQQPDYASMLSQLLGGFPLGVTGMGGTNIPGMNQVRQQQQPMTTQQMQQNMSNQPSPFGLGGTPGAGQSGTFGDTGGGKGWNLGRFGGDVNAISQQISHALSPVGAMRQAPQSGFGSSAYTSPMDLLKLRNSTPAGGQTQMGGALGGMATGGRQVAAGGGTMRGSGISAGSGRSGAMAGAMGGGTNGLPPGVSQLTTMGPENQASWDRANSLMQGGNMQNSPYYTKAGKADPATEQLIATMTKDAKAQFENEVIPAMEQQFAAQGGTHSGAFADTVAKARADFENQLANNAAQLRYQGSQSAMDRNVQQWMYENVSGNTQLQGALQAMNIPTFMYYAQPQETSPEALQQYAQSLLSGFLGAQNYNYT